MRIIHSTKDLPWTKEVNCHGCNSKLELDKSDLQFVGSSDKYVWTCPVCGHYHQVRKEAWAELNPKFVRQFKESYGWYDR